MKTESYKKQVSRLVAEGAILICPDQPKWQTPKLKRRKLVGRALEGKKL